MANAESTKGRGIKPKRELMTTDSNSGIYCLGTLVRGLQPTFNFCQSSRSNGRKTEIENFNNRMPALYFSQ